LRVVSIEEAKAVTRSPIRRDVCALGCWATARGSKLLRERLFPDQHLGHEILLGAIGCDDWLPEQGGIEPPVSREESAERRRCLRCRGKSHGSVCDPPRSRPFAFLLLPRQSCSQGSALGLKGQYKDGVYKFVIGRTTQMHGVTIGNQMGVNTWGTFAGTDDKAFVDGDFAMHESELQNITENFAHSECQIALLHNYLVGDSAVRITNKNLPRLGSLFAPSEHKYAVRQPLISPVRRDKRVAIELQNRLE